MIGKALRTGLVLAIIPTNAAAQDTRESRATASLDATLHPAYQALGATAEFHLRPSIALTGLVRKVFGGNVACIESTPTPCDAAVGDRGSIRIGLQYEQIEADPPLLPEWREPGTSYAHGVVGLAIGVGIGMGSVGLRMTASYRDLDRNPLTPGTRLMKLVFENVRSAG